MPDAASNKQDAPAAGLSGSSPALVCPSTREPLVAQAGGLGPAAGGEVYPLLDVDGVTVPWLLPAPDMALLEWKARLNGFLARTDAERERIQAALGDTGLADLTRERLVATDCALARRRDDVLRLIAPLGLGDLDFETGDDPERRLANKLPASQGLASYFDNIFRDWCWNNGENERLAAVVCELTDAAGLVDAGRVLTLGAGACRLPYDLHRQWRPAQSIVVDFNPLLLLTAIAVMRGADVELDEIPLAPRTLADTTRRQSLAAPAPLDLANDDSFLTILGDVTNLPFADGQMDVVVTPWLIDIVGADFAELVRRINVELVADGLWINTGSLAFLTNDPATQLSADEVLAMVAANGFEIVASRRDRVPYLCSPLSAHGREEELLSFVARRREPMTRPAVRKTLPAWLIDLSLPIPADSARALAGSEYLLKAQVLGAVDGQRSVAALGQLLAQHHGIDAAAATHAVRRIFVEEAEARQPTRGDPTP